MDNELDRDLADVAKLMEGPPDSTSEQRGLRRLEVGLDRLRHDPAEQQRIQEIVDDAEADSVPQPTAGGTRWRTGGGVFINYRAVDNPLGAAGIHDALSARFGANKVFRDSVSLEVGARYPAAIREALASSDVLVAIIGPRWLTLRDATGARLIDREHDWVRRELMWAHDRDIAVVPVLLRDTPTHAIQPTVDDLPSELRWFAHLQAFDFSQRSFGTDLDRLVKRLAALVPTSPKSGHQSSSSPLVASTAPPELVAALEVVPCMGSDDTRALLVSQLRPAISSAIPRFGQRRIHVTNILSTCMKHLDGISDLITAIGNMEQADSLPFRNLLDTLDRMSRVPRSGADAPSRLASDHE